MAGGDMIHWFIYEEADAPTPFERVDRPWGEAAVPLPYQIENGEYRITDRENELLATVSIEVAIAEAQDLGEVMWWVDDGTHLIPLGFERETVVS